jgi:hypothetical protein
MSFTNIVYLIEFPIRKAQNIMPYYYIGSKANCIFDGESIKNKSGKKYIGSSKAEGYKLAFQNDQPIFHILGCYDNYEDCISAERQIHLTNEVVSDPRYWNLAVAMENTFSNPDYCTVRHAVTGKTVRLKKDHPMILNGEYIGTTSGGKWYNDGIKDFVCIDDSEVQEHWVRGRKNNQNFARGDDHPMRKNPRSHEETMVIIKKRMDNMKNNPEKYEEGKKRQRQKASETHKGVPKSAESNQKRARRGLIMLKNRETGECVRIPREEKSFYDSSLWVNPFLLATPSGIGSKWCTDGITNIKLKAGQPLPDGFKFGRTFKRK